MKQPHLEFLARRMREHHRHHPWRLSAGGLYIPHVYHDMKPDDMSQWDDVGFILNGRPFMVWWQHPRHVYAEAIEALAWEQQCAECGDPPDWGRPIDTCVTIYKYVGSLSKRKKPLGERSWPSSEAQKRYYAILSERIKCIQQEGIDMDVQPYWTWKRYLRCMGLSIVAPIEVRSEDELAQLANLARQLVKRQITLAERFGTLAYGKADWLREVGGLAS